jgi:hypothetical protein
VGLFLRTSYFCSTRVWTQDLHLELLFQSFSWFFFFWGRVLWTVCLGWLWTESLLISASWVIRTTGVSHWHWLFLGFDSVSLVYASDFMPVLYGLSY